MVEPWVIMLNLSTETAQFAKHQLFMDTILKTTRTLLTNNMLVADTGPLQQLWMNSLFRIFRKLGPFWNLASKWTKYIWNL